MHIDMPVKDLMTAPAQRLGCVELSYRELA